MATSTIFNFNFNNSEIVDSTGQWYDATTGTPTTEFINHDGNTALFQPARTNGNLITPNPTMLQSYDPNFKAYAYTLEVQVCAVLNRVSNSSFILNFPNDEDSDYNATALGLFYDQNDTLEMWIDHNLDGAPMNRPILIDFSTAGFDRWFSVRIERTVDPNNPYIGATVKAYVDGAEVYNHTFTYAQSTSRGKIGPHLRYCEDLVATGGIAIDNLKLTAGIAPSSVVDVSLANLQRNNANLLSFIKGKVPAVNDGTLTIKVNGATAGTFTANQSTAATANITVPTAVSELTNDSGYLTASSNLDASKLTSGTVDIARLPQGALERLVKVANEAARYALTTADVQLGDTVQQLDTGIMYIVTDADHLDSAAGYTEYTAGTAASVPWSGVTGKPTFAAVATSGAYSDLTGTPTIPTVNDATLTIQKNGTDVTTFSANASTNATANITVPTKTSDLTNDSNFVQSSDLATVATSGSYNDLTDTPTIPTVNNATLTIQQNGTTVGTFSANSSTDKTVNIAIPTKTSDLTNDSGFITSDNTKIPLAGSNQISGSLIPSTDNSIDIGSSTKNIKMLYTKGIIIDGTQFLPSDYATLSDLATVATSGNYNDLSNKPTIPTVNDATLTIQKNGTTIDTFTANSSTDKTVNISVPTNTSELTNGAGFITADYAVPRSGGAVMTGSLYRTNTTGNIDIGGGTTWDSGAMIALRGGSRDSEAGLVVLQPATSSSAIEWMYLHPDGTWTWSGQAVQLTSDQRYKQQITEIDDKLLDAWEDVNLVQFKYNDAVDQKGDNARLHTGYVVQQIDNACKSHGVDVSQYGLYCHEEYPQETEEVEVEQTDGTKTKEKKVIREANEHYSLRYTEVYAVECMYLRRCIARLTARIEQLEKEREASK